MKPITSPYTHGGPDALGVPRHDFSTNANACGPCPAALHAVQQADATRYPDPSYSQLREELAAFHHVTPERVVLAGSASEFIFRITAWAVRQGASQVAIPPHGYGDYLLAAQAWGLDIAEQAADAQLLWRCEPASPLGTLEAAGWDDSGVDAPTVVLDRAYEPLRLSGESAWTAAQLDQVWQLWTPNKALGLSGVRAAYAIAPLHVEAAGDEVRQLCHSWPLGAHGVALLHTWVQPQVQTWLKNTHPTLRQWKARQQQLLTELGWECLPSDTNFFCARPHGALHLSSQHLAQDLQRLRASGIKLRDATSFGLPGHVRISVQPPGTQDALANAWRAPPREAA